MSNLKDKVTTHKDKILGEVKETVGKATGNESLELDGKILKIKSNIKSKSNVDNKADELKERISGKINDIIDNTKKERNNRK